MTRLISGLAGGPLDRNMENSSLGSKTTLVIEAAFKPQSQLGLRPPKGTQKKHFLKDEYANSDPEGRILNAFTQPAQVRRDQSDFGI